VNIYVHLWQYLAEFLEWEMFETKVVDKIKTRFVFKNVLRKSCRSWDNVAECGRFRQATDDKIIRSTRFTCWVTKATDTISEYVILNCFATASGFGKRLDITLCAHCLSCWRYRFSQTPYVRIRVFILFVSFWFRYCVRSVIGCCFGINTDQGINENVFVTRQTWLLQFWFISSLTQRLDSHFATLLQQPVTKYCRRLWRRS
jgi:hypothetical protein